MPTSIRACLAILGCAALAAAADPAIVPDGAAAGDQVRMATITIPVPDTAQAIVQPMPAEVTALLRAGWRIGSTTGLGRTADGKGSIVFLVLEHPEQEPEPEEAGPAAAADDVANADPASPAAPGTTTVLWDDGGRTRLEIAAPVGGRNPVIVTTSGANGNPLVTYHATAFRDRDGTTHVDARGEPVTGPASATWSPDSFAIAKDGTVTTRDDNGHRHRADVEVKTKEAGNF